MTSASHGGSPQSPQRPDYDQALKWMLSRAPDAFLALVAPGLLWRAERSPELPATARQADLVWEVEHPDGQRRLLHLELQTKVEADIGERMAGYTFRLWQRDRLPVRSVVVFLREAASLPPDRFVIPWEQGNESLVSRFEIVKLWEIPQERALADPSYLLWPLAGLMAGASVESTVQVAERLAEAPMPRQERSDLIGLLATLAGLRLSRQTVRAKLREHPMLGDLLRESSFAEEFREEGMAQGMAQGKVEEARRMARLALQGHFGALPEDLVAALDQADADTLEAIVGNLANETLEQVRARLGLQ